MTPLCSNVVHLMLSSSFFGASHQRNSSSSSSSGSSVASFLVLDVSDFTLPLVFLDAATFERGTSLSEASCFTLPFLEETALDKGTSLCDSSFLTPFFFFAAAFAGV